MNVALVTVKIVALTAFVIIAGPRFNDPSHFHPFMPFGFSGARRGRRQDRGDGGGLHHLLRLLRLRHHLHRRGGDGEPRPGPDHRDHRLHGPLHHRSTWPSPPQRSGLCAPASLRQERRRRSSWCWTTLKEPLTSPSLVAGGGGGGPADRDPGLHVRAKPHLLRDGARRAFAPESVARVSARTGSPTT